MLYTKFQLTSLLCWQLENSYIDHKYRILGTNVFLYGIKVKTDPLCTFCGECNETINHLFWDCPITSNFILDIEQCVFGQQFLLSKQDVFFGYRTLLNHPYNLLIFHLKHYVFNKKVRDSRPDKNKFLHKFKFVLQVEKSLSKKHSKSTTYEAYTKAFNAYCTMLFN